MQILIPHVSCYVTPEEFNEAITQNYAEIYVLTPKGLIKHHKLRGQSRFIRVKVDSIPGMVFPEIQEDISFLPNGKIPHELFNMVEAFFRKVMEVKKSDVEAMIWILWNEEKGYHLHVPEQTVSKASVRYEWNSVPSGSILVVDIHSHNTMNAFFSGTDDKDDGIGIRFSGVFGKLNEAVPATVWRFNYKEAKYQATMEDIFQIPKPEVYNVPKEWVDKIETPKSQPGTARGDWFKDLPSFSRRGAGDSRGYSSTRSFLEDFDELEGIDSKGKPWQGGAGSKKPVSSQRDLWEQAMLNEELANEQAKQQHSIETDPVDVSDMTFDELLGLPYSEGGEEDEDDDENSFNIFDNLMTSVPSNFNFDPIAVKHGIKAATMFCAIDELIPELDSYPGLAEETAAGLVVLLSDEEKVRTLHGIWNSLPEKERIRIQMYGL